MEKIKVESLKVGDFVQVIGGNNEIGQNSMLGKIGNITHFGTEYKVKGKKTRHVYVQLKYFDQHVFNDYHLKKIQ